jgi:hypothetical protein
VDALISSCSDFLKDCNFFYAICGGRALEMFIGKNIRPHEDIDISVFDKDRTKVAELFVNRGWEIYFRPVRRVNHLEQITTPDNLRL